ncbi:MAG: class I SAM-dependent methyltransferase [Alphaproteobacteria bacterium]|nr:class I SAM-dependent methyltransferase [Alphaproteobacteria bacterium]
MTATRPFSQAFFAHGGYAIDKWSQYLPVYDALLAPLIARAAPVDVLEIGVQNGGMLQLLQGLLPAGSTLTGIDIAPACAAIAFEGAVRVVIGNAADPAVVAEAAGSRLFDLVIDDGSHRSADVIAAFGALIGRVKPGGTYVVEDTHCSYWPAYGGGFRAGGSAIEHFKGLIDALHADHLQRDSVAPADRAALDALHGLVDQVSFVDSMIVARRAGAGGAAPHPRLFAGAQPTVADPLEYFVSRAPPADLANAIFAGAAAVRLPDAYIAARGRIAALEAERNALAAELQALRARPSRLRAGMSALRRALGLKRALP